MDYPAILFALSFFLLWFSTRIGISLLRKRHCLPEYEHDDLSLIVTAALTLLGLLIGFTFSMAISRYDLRKNYEEAEANAIGTEYVRADVLADNDAAKVRALLRTYLGQRILFYTTRYDQQLQRVNAETARLQIQLWSAVKTPAAAHPDAVNALALSGMNDVLNSQGYTQAAWWNRIPIAAWVLMATIAVACNMLVGFGMRRAYDEPILLVILPLIVAISFFLIAEIDSPRGGTIRVHPQNLVSLLQSLQSD